MKLLRELDGYLTPDEARKFRNTATDVITKYRDTLGARFKMAVSDRRWEEAIEFGEVIAQQFPNTKMAEEVQTMLETIRVRVGEDDTAS
jgi:outer membrane protein assembly factor BamD (BamD/ComL family)